MTVSKLSHVCITTPSPELFAKTKLFYETLGFKTIREPSSTEAELHLFPVDGSEGGLTLKVLVQESKEHQPIQVHSTTLENLDVALWQVFVVESTHVGVLKLDVVPWFRFKFYACKH